MKTILVPITFDSTSVAQFEQALGLAAESSAGLLLLHVMERSADISLSSALEQQLKHETRFILDQFGRRALGYGIFARTLSVAGEFLDVVQSFLKMGKAETLLLASSAASELVAALEATSPGKVMVARRLPEFALSRASETDSAHCKASLVAA